MVRVGVFFLLFEGAPIGADVLLVVGLSDYGRRRAIGMQIEVALDRRGAAVDVSEVVPVRPDSRDRRKGRLRTALRKSATVAVGRACSGRRKSRLLPPSYAPPCERMKDSFFIGLTE